MPEGSKAKTSGQAENGKEMTAKATAEKFEERLEHEKTAQVKNTTPKKEAREEVKKESPKKEEVVKEEVKKEEVKTETSGVAKESAQKTAKKAAVKAKKAVKEPVVPELILQYDDNGAMQADITDVIARVKAAYIADGHRESSIKSLCVYLKPQDWKAYYVINNKIEGNIDLF